MVKGSLPGKCYIQVMWVDWTQPCSNSIFGPRLRGGTGSFYSRGFINTVPDTYEMRVKMKSFITKKRSNLMDLNKRISTDVGVHNQRLYFLFEFTGKAE